MLTHTHTDRLPFNTECFCWRDKGTAVQVRGKSWNVRAGQGWAGRGRAGQGRARQNRAGQNRAGQNRARSRP